MEVSHYMFVGMGVAVSVLGFFLKKNKMEIDDLKSSMRKMELSNAKQEEQIATLQKISEDRRKDIQKLFELHG